jgi:hypothetical protein
LLAGSLPSLRLGEQVRASVLEATAGNTLIELNGMRVVVETLPGLRPGENLLVRLARLFPHPLLEVETSAQETPVSLPPLEVGQEVTAKVMKQLPGGRFLVDVQGTLLEATAPEGLRIGSELPARVDQLKPQVVFHILDQGQEIEAEALRILRTRLPHPTPANHSLNVLQQELARAAEPQAQDRLPPSMAKLQTLIKTLLPNEVPPNPERIATFVRDGGLHYEAKLWQLAERFAEGLAKENPQALARVADGDLKGLLLRALKDVEAAPVRSEAQGLVASMANHLNHIEAQQATNLLAQMHEGPYRLEVPFFSAWGFSTAFLSIEPDGKGGKEGKGEKGQEYSVLFLLDLEGFGQTRIDAHIASERLRVIFYVEQSAAVALLRSELPSFHETLHSLGYQEVFLEAKLLEWLSPEKRQEFDSLATGIPLTVSLVDVKA